MIGIEGRGPLTPFERIGKIVAGQCEGAETDEGFEVVACRGRALG